MMRTFTDAWELIEPSDVAGITNSTTDTDSPVDSPTGPGLARQRVDGWLTKDQGRLLFDAAADAGDGATIVEIGSFRGRSTVLLASGAGADTTVIAIDPHAGNDRGPQQISGFDAEANNDYSIFHDNLARAGVADRVDHIRAFSSDALAEVTGPIDVLFIDGAHRYVPARDDIVQWGALVADGGVMLIHDAFSSIGVTGAVATQLLAGTRFRYIERAGSLAVYRADLAPRDRWRNAANQAAQSPWFVRNLGIKVALSLGVGRLWERRGRSAPPWPY